jgi:CHASE3 domain sensor protein
VTKAVELLYKAFASLAIWCVITLTLVLVALLIGASIRDQVSNKVSEKFDQVIKKLEKIESEMKK